MMATPVHMVTCVDKNFAMPLAVVLASLDGVSAGDVVVHIIQPGMSAELRSRICTPIANLDVRWYTVDESVVADSAPASFLPPASLYRLLMGEVLPDDVHRVIYFDADTLVCKPPTELWAEDLGGALIGAVRDAASPWAAGPLGTDWRLLGMSPDSPYFNAGMMLIDLAAWRSAQVGAECLRTLSAHRLRWGDQDALNRALEGRWLELPRRWNVQSVDADGSGVSWGLWPDDVTGATADPHIVHFTGRIKPWTSEEPGFGRAEWYAALDRTAWRGWRPTPARPNALVSSGLRWARALKRVIAERPQSLPS